VLLAATSLLVEGAASKIGIEGFLDARYTPRYTLALSMMYFQ